MSTSFYVLMVILGGVSAINLFTANAQKKSMGRTFGVWLNGIALALIIIAIVTALVLK